MAGENIPAPLPDLRRPAASAIGDLVFSVDYEDPEQIEAWLDENPGVQVDFPSLSPNEEYPTIYFSMMVSELTKSTDPVVQKILQRNPDPTIRDLRGRTALDLLRRQLRSDPNDKDLQQKVRQATLYEQIWKTLPSTTSALQTVSAAAPVLAKKGLPPDVEDNLYGMITGQTGNTAVQMSKLRTSIGLPGVTSKGGRRRRRPRKTRRKQRKT
jgi:hypothetical protein